MMKKIHERRTAGQGGFTLIELLVVVAILAVLGGAAIIGIGSLRSNAQEQACRTDYDTVKVAVEAYKISVPTDTTPTIAEIQAEGLLERESNFWEVTGAGNVTAKAGAPATCTP